MIVNEKDLILTKSGFVYIACQYANTTVEDFDVFCTTQDKTPAYIRTKDIDKILTESEYPEYFL